MGFYWRWQKNPNREDFEKLKADVEKVSHVLDAEILELFGIEKDE